jgi:hypothetical protein
VEFLIVILRISGGNNYQTNRSFPYQMSHLSGESLYIFGITLVLGRLQITSSKLQIETSYDCSWHDCPSALHLVQRYLSEVSIFTICRLQNMWCAGFEAASKHQEKIIQLVDMMRHSGCPCFVKGSNVVEALRKRFRSDQTTVASLVDESVDAWTTRQYDLYQRVLNGIL